MQARMKRVAKKPRATTIALSISAILDQGTNILLIWGMPASKDDIAASVDPSGSELGMGAIWIFELFVKQGCHLDENVE